jgi:hypothetical protein
MRTRRRTGLDADSRITEALNTEARALAQIDQEDNEQKLRELPCPSQPVSYLGLYKDLTNIKKVYIYE